MIGKLGQIAIPSGDHMTFRLWSEYDEMRGLIKEADQDTKQNLSEVVGLEDLRNALVKGTLMLFKAK